MTEVLPASDAAIAKAAQLILAGHPVAVPTETVYGLAADATNGEAVARIYAAKGRPGFNPLIVHVRNFAQAQEIGIFSEQAQALAETYWPGPLTLVVPLRPEAGIADAVTAGLGTVALRCPKHPVMQALLAATGRPLAAPSANASGTISPTSAAHVLKTLGGRIPLVLDGGPGEVGLESTIIRATDGKLLLLRPGPIDLGTAVGPPQSATRIEAPGQLRSHYAPTKPLRLDVTRADAGEWLIGFGAISGDYNLSSSGDLDEAAVRLFAALHRADGEAAPRIAVAPIPRFGTGLAINDRLCRAAAPRTSQE
ncbi:MAG TPA: L-threonylcarbamoyladenylate synthase [Allosphingosinicella sp.]|uniref:L-threonylcarbamoyladenylate synthase n=1 Tax=Allosphingosinicella sp. TaxID=2823234 RepID=UPI002F280604